MRIKMIWQDWIFMLGNFIFSGSLIPSVLSEMKPHPMTCALTGGVLILYAIAFATMKRWIPAVATLLTVAMWLILLVQGLL